MTEKLATVRVGACGDVDRVKWACHVVTKILKVFKNFFQGVTTWHDYTVKCTCVTSGVTHFVNSSCMTDSMAWHKLCVNLLS